MVEVKRNPLIAADDYRERENFLCVVCQRQPDFIETARDVASLSFVALVRCHGESRRFRIGPDDSFGPPYNMPPPLRFFAERVDAAMSRIEALGFIMFDVWRLAVSMMPAAAKRLRTTAPASPREFTRMDEALEYLEALPPEMTHLPRAIDPEALARVEYLINL